MKVNGNIPKSTEKAKTSLQMVVHFLGNTKMVHHMEEESTIGLMEATTKDFSWKD